MSAYGIVNTNPGDKNTREFYSLPEYYQTKNQRFVLDIANETSDLLELYEIFADIIDDGQTYPQETTSIEEFKNYFYSYKTFVVRHCTGDNEQTSQYGYKAIAGFYIKPNFPGRSAHLANYGLIVNKQFRGFGIGNFMVKNCIQLAKRLSFRALYTNLVYETNVASIKICQLYGFEQVGRIPIGGILKGLGEVPALQFYKEL